MFTGIIQQIGIVKKFFDGNNLSIMVSVGSFCANKKIGDSISVDGTCLTIVAKTKSTLSFEITKETLNRTIAANYKIGQKVNLESSLKIGDTLDGHFVSGHIDFKSKISLKNNKLIIPFSKKYKKYFVEKGSVTINGVSLTVAKVSKINFEVHLIPHTKKITNLGLLENSNMVNVEVDLLARYLNSVLK